MDHSDDESAKKNYPRIKVLPPKRFKEDDDLEEAEKEKKARPTPDGKEFKGDRLCTDSEYHTATEYIPEFQSDNEPPEDKIEESKMIFKSDKLRIYKKIVKIGLGSLMPAKYDLVKYKLRETLAESMDLEYLDSCPVIEKQMGMTLLDSEVIHCLSNLKEGEKSTFRVEEVGYDDKKRRVVKRERFLMAEMISWQTVIDINGDYSLMKKIIERGVGQKRFDVLDEITFTCKVYHDKHADKILKEWSFTDCLITTLEDPLPSTLVEILKSSKAKEKFECLVEYEHIEEKETNEEFKSLLTPETDIIFEVEVVSIVERVDLFGDGSVIKKVNKKSYSTAAPDENSRLYFDYRAYDAQKNLIFSSKFC
jgi:hypothetical protein